MASKKQTKLNPLTIAIVLILVIAVLLILYSLFEKPKDTSGISNTDNIGNQLEKMDTIQVNTPLPNQLVSNPVIIEGKARGYWFFEGDAPVLIKDSMGNIIGQGIVRAKGNWMTVQFVNFQAQVNITQPQSFEGEIILLKDNPSGLPENDDQLIIPVKFKL
jgi:uncharacterized membrane protein YqiK